MTQTIEALLKSIAQGASPPVALLCGDEDYLVERALNRLLEALLSPAERELNLAAFSGERENVEEIAGLILTPPLLPGRRVVLVKNTRLLEPARSASSLLSEAKKYYADDSRRALRSFVDFLGRAGLTLDDLSDGGWRAIPDETWRSFGDSGGEDERARWLPGILDQCAAGKIESAADGGDAQRIIDALRQGLPPGNCLIFTVRSADRRTAVFKTLDELGAVIAFSKEKKDRERQSQFMERAGVAAAESGNRVTQGALRKIGEKTGYDLQSALTELSKISSFTEGGAIDDSAVDTLVAARGEGPLFELSEACSSGDARRALQLLRYLRECGLHELVLISLLGREIRFLLQGRLIRDSDAGAAFNDQLNYGRFRESMLPGILKNISGGAKKEGSLAAQHPYALYRMLIKAGRFSLRELKERLHAVIEAERSLKNTGENPEIVLRRLVIELSAPPNRQ